MKDTLLLGIGNVLLGDEGIGVHAVRYIEDKNLLPVLLECCEVVGENFEMLFNNDPQNWRDANEEIY